MRFLVDQDVYASTIRLLERAGHDVVPVATIRMAQAKDEEIFLAARDRDRILVFRDRGFGGLIFVRRIPAGVIFLRMTPATINQVHDELTRVLSLYEESFLKSSFVVVEPARHRIRQLPSTGP